MKNMSTTVFLAAVAAGFAAIAAQDASYVVKSAGLVD